MFTEEARLGIDSKELVSLNQVVRASVLPLAASIKDPGFELCILQLVLTF